MNDNTTDYSHAQKEARQIARIKLKRYKTPDLDQIRACCVKAKCDVEDDFGPGAVNLDELVEYFASFSNMYIRPAQVLQDPRDHEEWLPRRRSDIEWNFWTRYQTFLEDIENLPQPVVTSIDAQTETVLDLLEDPARAGTWDRRGLVVGSVQSGKTGNFMGLACKALDAGYKLIVILAGIHNSLRTQTQIRMEEAVLGFNTESNLLYDIANEKVGVGTLIFPDLPVNSLTSRGDNGDFSSNRLNATLRLGSDPFIIVVKKNARILDNLRKWLLGRNGVDRPDGTRIVPDIPMLMIDDEADHSSINVRNPPEGVKPEDIEPTAINGLIRKLMQSFERRAYVGFTATPFANIFVDATVEHEKLGDDIFPRSFILSLSAPPNYVGVERVFGRAADPDNGIDGSQGLPIVKIVTDAEKVFPKRHSKDFRPEKLPDSLERAIQSFILACTAREARGQKNKHNSMLVHVVRYIQVQRHVTRLITEQLRFMQRRIQQEGGSGEGTMRSALRRLWETDFEPATRDIADPACPPLSWERIEPFLLAASTKITVMEINGESADVLDYSRKQEEGISVIAVGGDKLSRGLTLYGLTVSYYLRVSRMYDSLLQMGRWFGYRDGYVDLCRIYTTAQLVDWYRHIALADAELREELARMVTLRATPEDYGLRVRTHPKGMLVTALNKSRASKKMRLSYAGTVTQSVVLSVHPDSTTKNEALVREFLSELGPPRPPAGGDDKSKTPTRVWESRPAAPVCRLLRRLSLPTGPTASTARGSRSSSTSRRRETSSPYGR